MLYAHDHESRLRDVWVCASILYKWSTSDEIGRIDVFSHLFISRYILHFYSYSNFSHAFNLFINSMKKKIETHSRTHHIWFSLRSSAYTVQWFDWTWTKIELAFGRSKLISDSSYIYVYGIMHGFDRSSRPSLWRRGVADVMMQRKWNNNKKTTTTTLNHCPGEITETHWNFTFFSIVCSASHGLTLTVGYARSRSCTATAGFFLWRVTIAHDRHIFM